jgi:glutamate carboxypeptidase
VDARIDPGLILEQLEPQRPAMIGLLSDLVGMESPSTDPVATRRLLYRLKDEFERVGTRVRLSPVGASGGYLFARSSSPPHRIQLVLGHADTVWPTGTIRERPWTVTNGRGAGPGSFDMKAGLVQTIFALDALNRLGAPLPAAPVVLINTDEEIGSRGSTPAIRRLSRLACRAFVLEPGLGPRGDLKTARKGLGRYTVTIQGRAAHAGLDPEAGASAILELSAVIQHLFALNDPDRGVTVNVGTIEGGVRSNVVAPHSEAAVDVRVLSHSDATEMDAAIRALTPTTPGTAITVEGGFGRPPMERTPANQALFAAARAIGERLGMDLAQVTAGGGSDGNTTSQFTATLDGLGIVGDGAHAAGEHIDMENLLPRTALLAALLLEPVQHQEGGGR